MANEKCRPAQERLHKAIAAEYELIAPESNEETEVKRNCLLSEWVLVSNWVDEDNDAWIVTLTSPDCHVPGGLAY